MSKYDDNVIKPDWKGIISGVYTYLITYNLWPFLSVIFASVGGFIFSHFDFLDIVIMFGVPFSILIYFLIILGTITLLYFTVKTFQYFFIKTVTIEFSDKAFNEKPYLMAVITNHTKRRIECVCVIESIAHNGKNSHQLKNHITKYTSRLSWFDKSGTDIGRKKIDSRGGTGTIKISSLNEKGLFIATDKGERNITDVEEFGTGQYKINLMLLQKMGNGNYRKLESFGVPFEYYFEGTPKDQLKFAGSRLIGPIGNVGIRLIENPVRKN